MHVRCHDYCAQQLGRPTCSTWKHTRPGKFLHGQLLMSTLCLISKWHLHIMLSASPTMFTTGSTKVGRSASWTWSRPLEVASPSNSRLRKTTRSCLALSEQVPFPGNSLAQPPTGSWCVRSDSHVHQLSSMFLVVLRGAIQSQTFRNRALLCCRARYGTDEQLVGRRIFPRACICVCMLPPCSSC